MERSEWLGKFLISQRENALNEAANLAADLQVAYQRISELEQEIAALKAKGD